MIPRISYLDLVALVDIQTREQDAHVDGNVSPFEIEVISRLVKTHNPKTLFEIGTFDGRTTLNLAANCSPDARIYTLDLPRDKIDTVALKIAPGDRMFIDKPNSGARFVGTDVEYKITQLYGDSATFDFSPYFGKIDFLFVDGSHSYDYVIQDSMTALKLVHENSIILWHDYVPDGPTPWPGLTIAINQLYQSDPRFNNMMQIAGTSAIIMRMPGNTPVAEIVKPAGAFGDSSQPEYLLASLQIEMDNSVVTAGTQLSFRARATNTGRAIWLPSDAAIGPVRLGSRLLGEKGHWLIDNYSRHFLPGSEPVTPGETITFEGQLACPPRGRHIIEFDLVAEGVAWFNRNGPTTVRIPIDVRSSVDAPTHEFDAEPPWPNPDRSECEFYHSMDFAAGDSVTGPWDLRGRFDQYIGHYPVHGKTVLDVGTASGFLAFSAEQAGAQVTALELEHVREINLLPFQGHSYYSGDRLAWETETQVNWVRNKKAFWYAWHRNQSNVEVIYKPLDQLRYIDRQFDVVFAGAILEHLGDPITAIGLIARVAKEAVIIGFTPVVDTDELLMKPITDMADSKNYFTWWSLSRGLYRRVFRNIGFDVEILPCRAFDTAAGIEVERSTIIARRSNGVAEDEGPAAIPVERERRRWRVAELVTALRGRHG